jgi:hypothetical protein
MQRMAFGLESLSFSVAAHALVVLIVLSPLCCPRPKANGPGPSFMDQMSTGKKICGSEHGRNLAFVAGVNCPVDGLQMHKPVKLDLVQRPSWGACPLEFIAQRKQSGCTSIELRLISQEKHE